MADINLLKNQLRDTTNQSTDRTKLVSWIIFALLLIVVAAGAVLFVLNKNVEARVATMLESNSQLQRQVSENQKGLDGAKTYQAQLSNIKTLLEHHISFSPLLAELESYTYRNTQYVNFDVKQDIGKIHVEGIVDSYHGLGVLLLGLSTSPNFENVKLLSVIGNAESGFTFSIEMDASPELFINQP